MKIRNGFVSNSSASSFLIRNVKDNKIIRQLAKIGFVRTKIHNVFVLYDKTFMVINNQYGNSMIKKSLYQPETCKNGKYFELSVGDDSGNVQDIVDFLLKNDIDFELVYFRRSEFIRHIKGSKTVEYIYVGRNGNLENIVNNNKLHSASSNDFLV